jgi:U3 small nucleolar RNA-associated protein 22
MHLFRAVLVALGNPKTFANNTVTSMQRRPSSTSQVAVPSPPKAASWRTGGNSIVFLDSSGWLNLGASVSQAALQQARECASLTISMFSASSGPDAFDAAFLTRRSLPLLFDAWYHVTVPDNSDTFEVATGNPFAQDRPWWQSTDARVSQLAAKGLSDRATLVRVFYRAATLPDTAITKGNSKSPHSHRLRKPNAILPQRRFVTLAVRLNPTEVLRSVDIGPPADSGPPAAAFRAFWGAKSELRRFQDGAIAEAVVWNRSLGQRHVIIDDLVRHVLTRHLPQGTVIETHCTILDAALYRRHGGAASLDEDLAISRRIEDASVRLGKRLRSLQGLVLKIVGTQPLAPSLRHAAVFPPQPHVLAGAPSSGKDSTSAVPRCLPAVEMLCQVEGSGKWPDDPDAFAKMKAAVGVQIAESLQSGFGMEAAAAEDYMDVYTDGFAFRLRLHTERDASMLEIQLARAGHTQPPPLDDVALKVWHHGAVSAAAAANPAFEPALRLAKRWVASQWLSPHLSEEAVELLMVAVFHGAGAGVASPPPASRLAGFLGFLRLLIDHPWAVQPLVPEAPVGVGGSTGCSRRNVAAKAHAVRRAAAAAAQNTRGAAPAMFLTGPRDDECVGWTQERPSAPMLHRIVVLARKAAAVLETRLLSGFVAAPQTTEKPTTTSFHQTRHALSANRTDVGIDEGVDLMEEVFVHDDSDYEVIIRLRADAIPHGDLAIKPSTPHRSSKSKSSLKVRTKILPRDDDAPESAKLSRAVLKGIPRSVLKSRGSSAVRKELLVAFEPVSLFVDLLEQRFADVAVVCADYVGGDAVGLKLKGPMLRLGPVKAETAHAQKPSGAATTRGDTALIVCPDIEAMAADALSLGIGLAECAEIKAM